MSYLPRAAESTLTRYLQNFPVLGLTGPRQAGKSTLLKHALTHYQYVTFDDSRNILRFNDDPVGFFKDYPEHIIFDEVQYVPQIFNYLKMVVDQQRNIYGNFILTGSSQFQFLQKVTESLAGRIGLMSLLPFQYSEIPPHLRVESIYKGGYPELVLRDYRESALWYASYLETYLNKDVRVLSQIGDLSDFRRFLYLLSAQATHQLEMSHYARDIGVSVPTIKRWLSILEASYIIFIVPPFYENYGKRVTKSPKVYFYDTGLISYLTGITTEAQFHQGPMAGQLFENYVVSEIYKKEWHNASLSQLYYFRTQDKVEVDLILDRKNVKEFIEIKKSATFHPKMVQALKKYAPARDKSFVLYMGEQLTYKDVNVIPYQDYLMRSSN